MCFSNFVMSTNRKVILYMRNVWRGKSLANLAKFCLALVLPVLDCVESPQLEKGFCFEENSKSWGLLGV